MKTVHVIFKTHLDIGFTDTAAKVMAQYKKEFIPKAMAIALELNSDKEDPEFVWTTGAYLIWAYLRTEDESNVQKMRTCIEKGYIRWHALPFTTHTELMDKRLFDYGLTLSKGLDESFNMKTIAGKMTDVPGHTIGMVPVLEQVGIKYLHLGVNPASKIPDIPTVFRWRHKDGSEVIVNYAKGYGEVNEIEGLDHILYFAHTDDNQGPPTAESVKKQMHALRHEYPECRVMASTLDAYAEELLKVKDVLPVVTQEIGDTWIHGIGTDPMKVAKYKTLIRLRDKWLEEGSMTVESQEYCNFSLPLALVTEHTWGMDHKKYMSDYVNYLPEELMHARETDNILSENNPVSTRYISDFSLDTSLKDFEHTYEKKYSTIEGSWQEQRDYIEAAIQALSKTHQDEAAGLLDTREKESMPDSKDEGTIIRSGQCYPLGGFREVSFGQQGEIIRLKKRDGRTLGEGMLSIGTLIHQSFDHKEYESFASVYNDNHELTYNWSDADFGKPGLEFKNIIPMKQKAVVEEMRHFQVNEHEDVVKCFLTFGEKVEASSGLPTRIKVVYYMSDGETIEIKLQVIDKKANRSPEALWLEMKIPVDDSTLWEMEKIGTWMSPFNVVSNGNRNMHAVNGLSYKGNEGTFILTSDTTPLVAIGGMKLLTFDNQVWNPASGFFYNIYNNIWGTNFPAWIEGALLCKFHMKWL